jgi:hypothetical protein
MSDLGISVVSNTIVAGPNPAEDIFIGFVLSYPVMRETWKLRGETEEQRPLSMAYCKAVTHNLSGQTEENNERPQSE